MATHSRQLLRIGMKLDILEVVVTEMRPSYLPYDVVVALSVLLRNILTGQAGGEPAESRVRSSGWLPLLYLGLCSQLCTALSQSQAIFRVTAIFRDGRFGSESGNAPQSGLQR